MPGTELFGDEERKEVMDVLETGILFRYNFDGPRKGIWKARTFEEEFSNYHGVDYCHMCSNGTAADIISLASVGIGAGDEVIVPPFSFIAPIEAVLAVGAVPVFAEIDETFCLSPEGIEAAITPRTKAVLLVQLFGSMARMDEIVRVCGKHDLTLVEDAAPALGGTYRGKHLGTFGKVGCFSFDFFKVITAGEGGAVITNDSDVYETAHMFGDHGHDHRGGNRGAERHPILGFNFRISELHAAVGLAQFRKLDFILARQREVQAELRETLSAFPQIIFRDVPDPAGDSATTLGFLLPDARTTVRVHEEMGKAGVGTAYWYKNNFHYIRNWEHLKGLKSACRLPIKLLDNVPDYADIHLPRTDDIMSRMQMIEIRLSWTREELDAIKEKTQGALREVLGG
jgi:8-amino-3,8-dideoxy-alpha-D-manno-octulosonate transaminase